MRHIPVDPPPFFHRGPVAARATRVLRPDLARRCCSLDTRYRYLENIRQVVAIVLYPLQRAVQMPGEALAYVGGYFVVAARADRGKRATEAPPGRAGRRRRRGCASTRNENDRLQALLDIRARYARRGDGGRGALHRARPVRAEALRQPGQPMPACNAGEAVIDEQGVVGQVTRVFPYMAEVTLVTDKDHAVPVKVERSGVRSVLFGAGAGRPPELRFMAPNADIRPGDVLVTSGIDGTYPPGLAVAQSRYARARDRADVRAHHVQPLGGRRSQRVPARAGTRRGAAAAPGRAERCRRREKIAARAGGGADDGASLSHAASLRPLPRKSCCPARPWFILLTLVLGIAREPAAAVRRRARAAARFPGAGPALLVHPGAAVTSASASRGASDS